VLAAADAAESERECANDADYNHDNEDQRLPGHKRLLD